MGIPQHNKTTPSHYIPSIKPSPHDEAGSYFISTIIWSVIHGSLNNVTKYISLFLYISLYYSSDSQIYNILNGHSAITANNFFEFNKTQTRKKHNLTLRTYQPRGNIDKFAFVQRSIPEWNTLPNAIVQANSTEQFQRNTYSKTRCLHWHSSNTHTQVHLRNRLQSPLKIIRRRRRRRRR